MPLVVDSKSKSALLSLTLFDGASLSRDVVAVTTPSRFWPAARVFTAFTFTTKVAEGVSTAVPVMFTRPWLVLLLAPMRSTPLCV